MRGMGAGASATQEATVLVVDDDPDFRRDLQDMLGAYLGDLRFVEACDGDEALGVLQDQGIDLIISDRNMPRMDGVRFFQAVSERFPKIPRILMTGQPNPESPNEAKACEVIAKPPASTRTVEVVRRLLSLAPGERPCGAPTA